MRDIARVLLAERINCVPIVDDARRPIGIVTTSEILRCVVREAPAGW